MTRIDLFVFWFFFMLSVMIFKEYRYYTFGYENDPSDHCMFLVTYLKQVMNRCCIFYKKC